ncbi:LysR family transcriptional regulator [Cellvibrio mixtus]|uniref:LysR family transcriptional regulator n=1 Tax=Cellvibrio mixtus TaxID=39650 RepID=UPI00058669E3|nr:LysR family transcriptional regulator [Cellvibrio mixtus]
MKTTLDEMQAFVRVVDTGSITAAADQLGQTVSALSRALARLEEKLEVTLMRRTTRRLELTEEGQVFLAQTRKIISAVEEAEEQMEIRRKLPAGLLRVNAASPFMLHVLVPLVRGFRQRYPDIELELNTNDQIIDLLEHRTDIAIRIGALGDSSLHARPLMTNRLRILASPGYVREMGEPKSPGGLLSHRLLGFSRPESLNAWPLRSAQGDRFIIAPQVLASSGETLRQLALAGEGIVCLADFMTSEDRKKGNLVQVLEGDTVEVLQPVNAVYYRNTALASRISCFLDYVSEQVGKQKIN